MVQSGLDLSGQLSLTLGDLFETREHARESPENFVSSATCVGLDQVQRKPRVLLAVIHRLDSRSDRLRGSAPRRACALIRVT